MMTKSMFRTSLSLVLGLAIAMLGPTVPAHADKVKRALIGIGGAIILNEIIKNQNKGPGNAKQSPGKKTYKKSGSKGGSSANNTVAQTQRALADLGYSPGPIDGQMGGKTRNAIMAFQGDRGYPVTGTLTTEQFAALNSAHSVVTESPAPGQMTAATKYEAQIYLKKLGYNVGRPDGKWGPKSQAALDAFRLDNGTQTHATLLSSDLEVLHLKVHGTPSTNLAVTEPGNLTLGSAPGLGAAPSNGQSNLTLGAAQPASSLGLGGVPDLGGGAGPPVLNLSNGAVSPAPNLAGNGQSPVIGNAGQPGLALQPGGAAQQSEGNVQAGFKAPKAPLSPAAYIDLDAGSSVQKNALQRRIAVQLVKARPQLLNDPTNLLQWFRRDNPRDTAAWKAYQQANSIQKEDILARFKSDLRTEIDATPAVSAQTPLPVAAYQAVYLGQYVDGQGLNLSRIDGSRFTWRLETPYLNAWATLRAEIPGGNVLKITAQEASQLIDYVKASKQSLYRVVLGQVSSIGEDETVASFAKPSGEGGYRDVATTFFVDKVSLNLMRRASKKHAKSESTLYTFPKTRAQSDGGGEPVLSYLQKRQVPVLNGHLLLGAGAGGYEILKEIAPQAGRQTGTLSHLAYLTWLKQNPDFASKGMNFVSVAARVMTEQDKRRFFGDGAKKLRYSSHSDFANVGNVGYDIFPDEFAAQDAKRAFLDSYYPRTLATVPTWPVPVIHVIGARLARYNVEGQYFPIIYDGTSEGRNALAPRVAAFPSERHGRISLASADRLNALPTKLEIPPDQARPLRNLLGQSGRVYLGWIAEFNMEEDGSDLESQFDPSRRYQTVTRLRPGRATLARIALFRDRNLSQVLVEYDPAEMVRKPRFGAPANEAAGAEDILANMQLAEPFQLLKSAVDMINQASVERAVVESHQSVRNANEFDVDARIEDARQVWDNIVVGDFWFQGSTTLGRYNRETGRFPVETGRNRRLNMGSKNPFGAYVEPQFVGENLLKALDVDEDIAREIVANEWRDIQYYVRVRPVSASRDDRTENKFKLMVRPLEVIYVQPKLGTAQVLSHHKFGETEDFFTETFAASDFPELQARMPFDLGAMMLLRVKSMSDEELEANLDDLMGETFFYENQRDRFVPHRFFTDMRHYDVDRAALYRNRFRNWIKARAEALGTKFTLTHGNRESAGRCGEVALLRKNYDVPGQWGVETSGMLSDVERVQQASLLVGGETAMRDHLYFSGKIQGQNRKCNLSSVVGVLSLDGVGLVPAQAENRPFRYQTRQIEFDLTELERKEGRDGIPLLLLKGTATETRFYDSHANNISGVLPTRKITNQQEPVVAGTDVERLEQAAFKPGAADTVSADTLWPSIDRISFSDTGRDMVGVRVGDTMQHAEAVVTSEFDVDQVLETLEPGGGEAAFDYIRTFVIDGGKQAISLMSYSPNGPVIAVNRHMLRNDKPWPQEVITASLQKKYADPTARASDDSLLVWSASEVCAFLPLTPIGKRKMAPRSNSEASGNVDKKLAAGVIGSIATISDGNDEFLSNSAECGEVVLYSGRLLSPVSGYHGFYTFMTDFSAIASVAEAMKPEEAEIEIKF